MLVACYLFLEEVTRGIHYNGAMDMLVLSRKLGERLMLLLPDGGAVAVSVEYLGNTNVKLGIDAPEDVAVLREELVVQDTQTISREG